MKTELQYAARRLRRAPGYALTVALSLALAIGAGAAAFSVLDAVRFRALPFRDGDRLVIVSEVPAAPEQSGDGPACRGGCEVSYETFANLLTRQDFRSAELVSGYTAGGKALNLGGEPIVIIGGVVSDNLFELLGAQPALGRSFTADDNRLGAELVTVLSHDLWTNQFASDPGIIGQVIKLSDSRYTVIGVMEPGFEHESGSKFWLPSVPTLDPSTRPSIRSLTVIARLKPGATVAQFRTELAALDPAAVNAARPRDAAPIRLDALPLRERYTAATQSHDLIFAAVVACILLIAAANLANMALVRALHQQREFAVRSALGASRRQLIRQLGAEQAILVVVAAAAGLLFARWLLGVLADVAVLQSLRPTGMSYRIDARAAAFAIGLAALFGVFLSLLPARLAQRTDLQHLLRQGGSQLAGLRLGAWAQRVFVVAQIAAAVVLATAAVLMTKTVLRLARVDLGFDTAHVIDATPSFPHPWRVRETYEPVTRQISTELALLPGVAGVGVRATTPLGPRGAAPNIVLADRSEPLPSALVPRAAASVDTGYFGATGIALARGRGFTALDAADAPPVAIVNDWAAARWWPGADPIGQVIQIDTAPGLPLRLEVVGVVRNNKAAMGNLLLAEDGPELYRPLDQASSAFPTFVVRATGSTAPLLKPVKDILVRLVPDRPLSATPVSIQADRQLAGVRINAFQIMGFAAIGLALALLGVYGVLSYLVSRRTREIGIRSALGAGTEQIRAMVLRDTVLLAVAGVAIGLPVAVSGAGLLATLLHGTRAADPVVLGTVGVVMIAVAMAAGLVPARRAARVDPLEALRTD
ncbi:MAG: ADOP family duplicated permease [Gemmatimonadales bacterium]